MPKIQRFIIAGLIVLLGVAIPYFYLDSKKALITITGNPPYKVFVNSEEHDVGTNPYLLPLETGSYSLVLFKDHFSPISKTLSVQNEEEQLIVADFDFLPYLEESSEKKKALVLAEPLEEASCQRQLRTSAGNLLKYCYDYSNKIGRLLRIVGSNPPQTLSSFTDLPGAELLLSPDEKKLLLYSFWLEGGSGYLIDLGSGYKEQLWKNKLVAMASFVQNGKAILFEELQGEGFEDYFPTKLLYLTLADNKILDTGAKLHLSKACVADKQLYTLDYRETVVPNKLETLEDLEKSFSDILGNSSSGTTLTQVLSATNLQDLTNSQVLVLPIDTPELGALVCDEQAGLIYLDSLEDERHYVIHITEA